MTIFDLHLYQIVVVLISCMMIYVGFVKYLKQEVHQSLFKLLVRLIVWGGMIAITLYPKISNNLAQVVGIEGNINAVMLVGFLVIFLIIFKILSVIERIEQDISTLTRKKAIEEMKKEDVDI